jgi:autoinducer 2-degrading protein
MFTVFVTIDVLPAHVEAFIAASRLNHLGSLAEPGCRGWDVLRDRADPNRFYLHEVYVDQAAFAAHQQMPHYFAWKAAVEPWMARPRTAIKADRLMP